MSQNPGRMALLRAAWWPAERPARCISFLALCLLLGSAPVLGEEPLPRLEPLVGAQPLEGASLWLFLRADGQDKPLASMERPGSLWVGRVDPLQPSAPVAWQQAAGAADTGGQRIADHWHVFAHGHHFLAFSTQGARRSFLLKLSPALERVGLWPVATEDEASPPGDPRRGSFPVITNDLFLAGTPAGVTIGHFLPGFGSRLYAFSAEGQRLGVSEVGGGRFRHANGSSAQSLPQGLRIFASETLAPHRPSRIFQLDLGAEGQPRAIVSLLEEAGKGIVMPSAIPLPEGRWLLVARVREASRSQREPSPRGRGQALPEDGGALVRYLLGPRGRVLAREVLVEKGANRPHCERLGDLVLTSWDARGRAWLQSERLILE